MGSSNPLRTKTGKTAVGESVSHNDRVETAGVLTLESLQRQRVVSVAERWVVMSRARALSLLFVFVCMHACMYLGAYTHTFWIHRCFFDPVGVVMGELKTRADEKERRKIARIKRQEEILASL